MAESLELYSFYETLKTTVGIAGIGNIMIVDKSSATLDYRHEQRFPVRANHRGICKFDQPSDPNYILIRNVLAKIVEGVGEESKLPMEHLSILEC